MLRILREAIMAQGGDPEELARLRHAKEVLGRYRQLRASLEHRIGNARTGYADEFVSSSSRREQKEEVTR